MENKIFTSYGQLLNLHLLLIYWKYKVKNKSLLLNVKVSREWNSILIK